MQQHCHAQNCMCAHRCSKYVHNNNTRLTASSSRTTRISLCQKSRSFLAFNQARDYRLTDWTMCESLQMVNHASTPSPRFLDAGCSLMRQTNSVKAVHALNTIFTVMTRFLQLFFILQCFELPSVLWRCWLGGRKLQNVKDRSHANKCLRKIKINLRTKVEICISTYSNADVVCYSATWRMELNESNSVRLIVDRG